MLNKKGILRKVLNLSLIERGYLLNIQSLKSKTITKSYTFRLLFILSKIKRYTFIFITWFNNNFWYN